jgi:hypothetical protein
MKKRSLLSLGIRVETLIIYKILQNILIIKSGKKKLVTKSYQQLSNIILTLGVDFNLL